MTFQGTLGSQALTVMTTNGTTASEVQTINFTGGAALTGGTFKLTFNSVQTPAINYSSNPGALQANIQNALSGLSSIGLGNTGVVVNATATSATVNFQNALANQPLNLMTADGSGLGSGAAATVARTTAGFVGLTGGSPSVATTITGAAPVSASQTGLLGTSNQTISVAVTTTGFGLVPSSGSSGARRRLRPSLPAVPAV